MVLGFEDLDRRSIIPPLKWTAGTAAATRLAWLWWLRYHRSRPLVVKKKDVPGWMVSNHNITRGYRKRLSVTGCICSCGGVHNETFNIWSHWFGVYHFLQRARYSTRYLSRTVACSYILVFSISTLAHTMGVHGEKYCDTLFSFDKAAIAFALATINLACIDCHFSRTGETQLRKRFLLVGLAVSLASIITIFRSSMARKDKRELRQWKKYRQFNCLLFAFQTIMGIVPVLRELALTESPIVRGLIKYYLPLSLGWGAIAVVVYVSEFPEKYLPAGWCDYIGSSHNLMHVLVLLSCHSSFTGLSKWELEPVLRRLKREA